MIKTFLNRPFIATLIAVMAVPLLPARSLEVTARDRDRLKTETMYAIDLIQSYHYRQKSVSDLDAEELLKAYMSDLDSSRLFLLQEDVDFTLERFGHNLKSTYLFVGDLFPAFEIFNLYLGRVYDRLDWIADRLQRDFDLETDLTFRPDRRKLAWPESAEDADDLWERRLKFELIAELLEEEGLDNARERVGRRYERMRRHLDAMEIHTVQETFLTSLAQLYDPHTSFFSWESAREFDISIRNSLIGIGAHLRDIDGYCVLERLLPGGPAEMSGQIHPGDKIVGVAQGIDGEMVDVVGMRLRRVVQMIRGEPGTIVRLSILPSDSGKRHEVVLRRERIELTANLASAELFELPVGEDQMRPIGVIRLPSFYGEDPELVAEGSNNSTTRDVEALIQKLKAYDIEGLVIDLRDNGGGRLDEAINMTGLFIEEGPVVLKRNFRGQVEEDWHRNNDVAWDGPLVVLVSRQSASASEIVAGALQAYGRALVVGDRATHGKGTVQAPIDLRTAMRRGTRGALPNVGMVKITVQKFYLANGESTQNRGVKADIVFPSLADIIVEGESDLPNALEWDQIEPISFRVPQRSTQSRNFVTSDLVTELEHRSFSRREESAEFGHLNRSLEWFRERRDRKDFSLNLAERQEQRRLDREMRDAFDLERRELALKSLEGRSIDLAITAERRARHQQKLRENPLPNGLSRSNQFYQRVFYYENPETGELHDLWAESFDYNAALRSAEEIAEVMTKAFGFEVSSAEMEQILTQLRNSDPGSEFNATQPFANVLGDRVEAPGTVEAVLPAFFSKLVQLDESVLRSRPALDIPLREALNIVSDWIDLKSADLSEIALAARRSAPGKAAEGTPQ
jgi:carboxyl-terminal processing protease